LPTIEVSAEQTSSGKQPATAPTLADLPVGASSELNVTGQTLNQRAYDRPRRGARSRPRPHHQPT
jgi:hypothetical protein